MKTIVILGGTGYTGSLIARHLLEKTDVHLRLAVRSLDKAIALAGQLNAEFSGERVSALRTDAADPLSMRSCLQDAGLLIVAAPLTSAPFETVIRVALDTGVDYLDVQIGENKLAFLCSLAGNIEKAGLCFITEAGFHPGLPSLLVRFAAGGMDSIKSAVVAGYLNMGGKKIPFTDSVDELMEMFKDYQAQTFENRTWNKPSSFKMRRIDFGGDIGRRNCFSMYFPELQALPEMLPSIEELGFYLSETHWFLDYVINYIVLLGLKLFPVRGVRPLGKLIWWGMMNLPKPPHKVELRVDARGSRDGHPCTLGARIAHTDGYEFTAIPVAAALLQVLDGTARKPGLWMMGHLVDPDRLLTDMQAMGVEFTRDT